VPSTVYSYCEVSVSTLDAHIDYTGDLRGPSIPLCTSTKTMPYTAL